MDFETGATPAGLLAADGTAATSAGEAPPFSPATTTPRSLLNELPPRPPSPYKTMQHVAHRTTPGKLSVTASFLRGRRNLNVAVPTTAATLPSQKDGAAQHDVMWHSSAVNSFDYTSTQKGDSAVVRVDAETHDSAMQHYLLYEAPRQHLIEDEENERNALLAKEEVIFTCLLIRALQVRAELLAGDEAAELVVAASLERAEARREMLQVIEVEVSARLREERLGEMLEVQFRALLPAHEVGRHRIEAEEREDLRRVFLWHKEHRPLGPGCFIKGPEEDYRLRHVIRGTSAATTPPGSGSLALVVTAAGGPRSALSSALSSREYVEQLRQKNSDATTASVALGELALLPLSDGVASQTMSSTQDGTFGPGEEAIFAEEGRLRLQTQKTRQLEELRERRRVTDLVDAQADARQYVLAEEALCWMHLTCAAMDGLYAAVEATRLRGQQGAADTEAESQQVAQRNALKEQLRRERGLPAENERKEKTKDGEPPQELADGAVLSSEAAHLPSIGGASTRKNSDSTVSDSTAATDAFLDHLPNGEDDSGPDYGNRDLPFTHLRLIAEETDSSTMCRQLTTFTSSEMGYDEL